MGPGASTPLGPPLRPAPSIQSFQMSPFDDREGDLSYGTGAYDEEAEVRQPLTHG